MPSRVKSGLIPAVGYLRRSTDKQEASIAEQRAAIERYAAANGYTIIRWYVDDAVSGDATEKRRDFQQMIADSQDKGDFQAILVWDQSRFGRFSAHEASYWTWPLAQAGVQLVTTDKGTIDWNDFTQWLTYSVNQYGKKEYLIDLSKDVTRGQLEAMKQGGWVGSPPYGYRIEGERKAKRLVLGDPAKVQVVRRIFLEYVQDGRSMTNIAQRLEADGVPSPGGRKKPWRFDTIKVILANPAYVGDFIANRYSYGKYHTIWQGEVIKSDGERRRKPETEWIVHRDRHDAIINRETFAKAQAILAKGKTGRNLYTPETNPYLLSGLLRCGHCGAPLWGEDSRKYRYYECSRRRYEGKAACEGTTVREDKVLRCIANYLNREFLALDGKELAWKAHRGELKPGDRPRAFARIRSLIAPPKQPANERQRATKELERLTAQIEKARRNLVLLDPENIPAAQDAIRNWEVQRGELESECRKRPPTTKDVNAEVTDLLQALYWLVMLFRCAAQGVDPDSEEPQLIGVENAPEFRQFLRRIEKIVVHTRKQGSGTGTRHVFEGGELVFRRVGGVTGNLNPHPAG